MKIDRLIGILTCLLHCKRITAPELACRFEVSRRTILRDIDALARAGIPVVTAQGEGGGISLMEGYQLDKGALTQEELSSVIAGIRCLESVSKTSSLEQLITKLSPGGKAVVSMRDSLLIDLSSHDRDTLSEKIACIKQAILERRAIEFDYYYQKGETRRAIEPYFIQFKWSAWYVFGWCRARMDFRLFKLNRLWELSLTDERYSPRDIPQDAAERDVFESESHSVRLLFDRSVRYRLIEDYGPHCYTETEQGLLLELGYVQREHTVSWVLAFGEHVTVLAPEDFKREVALTARRMTEKYSSF